MFQSLFSFKNNFILKKRNKGRELKVFFCFFFHEKTQQKDVLVIKSQPPSVGVMKWPALAEDPSDPPSPYSHIAAP